MKIKFWDKIVLAYILGIGTGFAMFAIIYTNADDCWNRTKVKTDEDVRKRLDKKEMSELKADVRVLKKYLGIEINHNFDPELPDGIEIHIACRVEKICPKCKGAGTILDGSEKTVTP
jgi:hypothetical protein